MQNRNKLEIKFNTMTEGKMKKGQTMDDKTLHRKLKVAKQRNPD
jgi:hypothetical protein